MGISIERFQRVEIMLMFTPTCIENLNEKLQLFWLLFLTIKSTKFSAQARYGIINKLYIVC